MNNLIMDNGDVVYYVVKMNGKEISRRFNSRTLAEAAKNDLPNEAKVVPVTADGKQVLME